MKNPSTCKHVWKQTFSERCISSKSPETKDEIHVGFFCPKCSSTYHYVHCLNRERAIDEQLNNQIYKKLDILQDTSVSSNERTRLKKNLLNLGYSLEEILTVLSEKELTTDIIRNFLKDSDKQMAEQILNGEYIINYLKGD